MTENLRNDIISVNTGTAHIAAANPQHTPWKVASKILYFSVKEQLKSKNEVVNLVSKNIMNKVVEIPSPVRILEAVQSLLKVVNSNSNYK